jgi:outer membrane protein assembly factor BamB
MSGRNFYTHGEISIYRQAYSVMFEPIGECGILKLCTGGKMASLNYVYLGINGCAIALDETTGVQIWASKLKGGDFVNLTLADTRLYAATKGEIFCLDPVTGKVLWQNPLRGMGHGLVCIAAPGSQPTSTAAIKQKINQDRAAAAAAATAAGS